MTAAKTVLGSDDVRAIVADCGTYNLRIGSSGHDTPRVIIPSAVGLPREPTDVKMTDANVQSNPVQPKTTNPYIAGDVLINAPKRFRQIVPLHNFDNNQIDINWDAMEKCWRSSLQYLQLGNDAPFLVVEPTRMWTQQQRAQALERAIEALQMPAAFIARGSAMAAFASARTSACVLDVGYYNTCAVPVIDGYAMHKKMFTSVVGGKYLSEALYDWVQQMLHSRPNYDGTERKLKRLRDDDVKRVDWLRAPHEIQKERLERDGQDRKYKVTDLSNQGVLADVTESHRAFYRLRVIDDMKVSTFRVSQTNTGENGNIKQAEKNNATESKPKDGKDTSAKEGNEKEAESKATKESKDGRSKDKGSSERSAEYCLPDGNVLHLQENNGMSIPNLLFQSSSDPSNGMLSVSHVAFQAISACDLDLRRDLFNSLVITGGSSLIPGVVERVTREVAILTPQMYKLKVYAPTNYIERTCASWIGGSIVSSLGTFQQAWVSKAEYDEQGAMNALRKCP
ncbi:actin [Gracilaria domingensis]|nr:actin [Gracilaria domingensis]